MSFDDKTYLVNNVPVSANELLDEAKCLDPSFGSDGLLRTSVAARIIRDNGGIVENIQDSAA